MHFLLILSSKNHNIPIIKSIFHFPSLYSLQLYVTNNALAMNLYFELYQYFILNNNSSLTISFVYIFLIVSCSPRDEKPLVLDIYFLITFLQFQLFIFLCWIVKNILVPLSNSNALSPLIAYIFPQSLLRHPGILSCLFFSIWMLLYLLF